MSTKKLPDDFPGLAALNEAGEATPAKVRSRIDADTLTEIPGIGEATAVKIKEAFAEFEASEAEPSEATDPAAGTTGDGEAALTAGEAEAAKPGAEKNEEPNHDLAGLTPQERVEAGIAQTAGERVRDCGSVFVHDPAGPYASRTAVRIPPERGRIKIEAIGYVNPHKGMLVKDGEDVYNIQEELGPDARGDDWLKVRSPNTGLSFIR